MILEAQPDIRVVAEAADGEAAVRLARRHAPDVVLMDVRMPGLDGLEATRRILAGIPGATPRRGSSILTTFDLDEYVYAALQSGASGFLLKDVSPEQLVARGPDGRRSATRCWRRRSRAASSSGTPGHPRSPTGDAGGHRDA